MTFPTIPLTLSDFCHLIRDLVIDGVNSNNTIVQDIKNQPDDLNGPLINLFDIGINNNSSWLVRF